MQPKSRSAKQMKIKSATPQRFLAGKQNTNTATHWLASLSVATTSVRALNFFFESYFASLLFGADKQIILAQKALSCAGDCSNEISNR